MELVDGALSAKSSGGSSGGGGTTIHPGDGLRLDVSNYMHVDYDSNTMTIQDGKLKALIFSGGNVPTEDVLTRLNGQSGQDTNDTFTISCGDDNKARCRSGNIIKLWNRSYEVESYVLIVKTDSIPSQLGEDNAILVTKDNLRTKIKIWNDFGTLKIVIPVQSGMVKEYGGSDTDVGLFVNTTISWETLVKVVQFTYGE